MSSLQVFEKVDRALPTAESIWEIVPSTIAVLKTLSIAEQANIAKRFFVSCFSRCSRKFLRGSKGFLARF